MIKGLRTAKYITPNIEKGKEWYSKVLGFPPYFDEPFYVGFNVEGFELGLVPDGEPSCSSCEGVVAYWGVDDIDAVYKKLLSLGAKEHTPVTGVGGDLKIASVFDPFGNIFGIIYNPHFKVER